MRIEGTSRSTNVAGRSAAGRAASGAVFDPTGPAVPGRASAIASTAPSTGIEGLLALQSVEDPAAGKKKEIRRARSLLDALDALKADLLVGRIGEGRLNLLMALLAQARQNVEPGLNGLLDDIELRARVELAKFGKYPGR